MEPNNNNTATVENWEVTESQVTTQNAVDETLTAIRNENLGTLKETQAIKKAADTYKGAENEPDRINLVAALAGINPDTVDPKKAGVTNITSLLTARYFGEPFDFDWTKKEKEDKSEPNELEQSLAALDTTEKIVVAATIKKLSKEDLNFLTSAIHAAFTYCMAILSPKKNPIPQQAVNMVQFLIGMTGGSTESFTVTDAMIAQAQKVSTRTVMRARDALIKWQETTGIGIVDIIMGSDEGKGTTYKVNILEMSTNIVQKMLTGTSPKTLMDVAALAGKFIEADGRERLQKLLPPDVFTIAEKLANDLTAAVTELPTPTLQLSAGRLNAAQKAIADRFEGIGTALGETLEQAQNLGLDDVEALEKLALMIRTAREEFDADNAKTPDFDFFEKAIATAKAAVIEASKGNVERAQAAKREALAATGDIATAAAAEVDSLSLPEEVENLRQQAITRFNEATFTLAAIAERDGADTSHQTFLACQETLQRAFSVGVYAAETPDSAEEAATA